MVAEVTYELTLGSPQPEPESEATPLPGNREGVLTMAASGGEGEAKPARLGCAVGPSREMRSLQQARPCALKTERVRRQLGVMVAQQ